MNNINEQANNILIVNIVIVVAVLGLMLGNAANTPTGAMVANPSTLERVVIKPFDARASSSIRAMPEVSVNHEFPGKFSATVPSRKIPKIKEMAEVEEVQLYFVLAKPVCGDNNCQGNEKRTCPSDCPSEPEGRTHYPSKQIPWGVEKINGGSGGIATVTVIDTGVYKEHLDLTISLCKDATRRGGIKNGCKDDNGHGTHVSGTIGANGGPDGQGIIGVAPNAELWHIKVCGRSGNCWTDDMAAAIRHAADKGTNILSMSIGGDVPSPILDEAIDYAVQKGVLVVAAAGNDGPQDGTIDYPGANVKVIAAGAIDVNENVPDFSSRGINDGDYIIEEREVEFGAPGVGVESTWNDGGYRFASGTSMSTPHVAGKAALVWQGNAADTRTYLQQLAKNHDLHTAGDDTATGFGLPS